MCLSTLPSNQPQDPTKGQEKKKVDEKREQLNLKVNAAKAAAEKAVTVLSKAKTALPKAKEKADADKTAAEKARSSAVEKADKAYTKKIKEADREKAAAEKAVTDAEAAEVEARGEHELCKQRREDYKKAMKNHKIEIDKLVKPNKKPRTK